ncbi:MAG: hypothetical protein Q8R79_02520 [Legionellaceae bacterium]|nr:hypothetical protein [Legionellaceae bacterium]
MSANDWEVVVLKPTSAFLSFIAEQLGAAALPELRLIQTDNTAYLIPAQLNNEVLLETLECHYKTIFSYEIARWVGQDVVTDIKASFLDFLCAFTFELHSNLLVMEVSSLLGRQLLRIKPRELLLKWMKAGHAELVDNSDILNKINLSHITENATAVIKNFEKLSDVKPFLRHYYPSMYEAERLRIESYGLQHWPYIDSYQMFSRFFVVELHTRLVPILE